MYKLLDGKKLSEEILNKARIKVSKMKKKPVLAVILVGKDKASYLYVSLKEKACQRVGIVMKKYEFKKSSTKQIMQLIQDLNKDKSINGIMVQLPLPNNLDRHKILSSISSEAVSSFSIITDL